MTGHKGSVLILVLWVLIILSLLSIAISFRASGDVKLAKYESENIKAMYLAKAGVIKAIAGLNKDPNNYDSLNEDWNFAQEFRFGGGVVTYSAIDEERRLNLNGTGQNLKEELFRLGLDNIISQNIWDYKVMKGEKGFEFMEELFLIDGMTRDVYSIIEPYISIYRGNDSKVNINTAGENVLRAIIGDDMLVNKVLEYRRGNDGIEGTEDDNIFKTNSDISVIDGLDPSMFTVSSNFFRIRPEVYFSEDKKIIKSVICVADRNGKIYYWKEE